MAPINYQQVASIQSIHFDVNKARDLRLTSKRYLEKIENDLSVRGICPLGTINDKQKN